MVEISKRDQIIDVVNRLFIYTDQRMWDNILSEVFAENVTFDMSSAGGAPVAKIPAKDICSMWNTGFQGIDYIHHQAGNYLVSLTGEGTAEVFCYAVATHFKKAASKGNVREFVGSYDIMLVLTDLGWRISAFRYNLKYMNGNVTLE